REEGSFNRIPGVQGSGGCEDSVFCSDVLLDVREKNVYIPLELRFASKKWDRLKFIVGANVGVQPFVHQVFMTETNGKKSYFTNVINDRNLLSYGVHFRFGFRNLALFGSYQLSPLFHNAESTKIHPIQFGLSLSLF
ncbi:MAG: hypothetical protein EBS86_13210, partial [Crocinitomicaceae bacterium]|nr:hypothetical protein [Crocinitomicaceae bacterium]